MGLENSRDPVMSNIVKKEGQGKHSKPIYATTKSTITWEYALLMTIGHLSIHK